MYKTNYTCWPQIKALKAARRQGFSAAATLGGDFGDEVAGLVEEGKAKGGLADLFAQQKVRAWDFSVVLLLLVVRYMVAGEGCLVPAGTVTATCSLCMSSSAWAARSSQSESPELMLCPEPSIGRERQVRLL